MANKNMTPDVALEILNLTYSKIMQLNVSYSFFVSIVGNNNISLNYPNLCIGLMSSFVSDAYSVIAGLLTHGKRSLYRLREYNGSIMDEIDKCESDLNKLIPGFRDTRNEMFCHVSKAVTFDVLLDMFNKFPSVFSCLRDLHQMCVVLCGFDESDIVGYSDALFTQINIELSDFNEVLIRGHVYKVLADKGFIGRYTP